MTAMLICLVCICNVFCLQVAVAVKTLYGKQEVQGQFIKEANSMCSLNHKNIIQLYGIVLSHPLMLVGEGGKGEGGRERRGEERREWKGEEKLGLTKFCDIVLHENLIGFFFC